MRLTLTAPAALEAADTDARVLRGIAIPYGQRGFTSAGALTIDAGAINVPENLRTVKLFREHGRTTPVGYGLEADDTAEALRMGFKIAATADGDQSLLEAAEGVRDALSVELNNVVVKAGHVTSADLVAMAQVAVPAFAGTAASLAAALTDEDQAQVLDLAAQIVALANPEADPDADPDAADTPPETGASMTRTNGLNAGAGRSMAMTPPTRGTLTAEARARRDRKVWASAATEALRGASDASQVNAALADITPADSDPDGIFPRPAWLGALWQPEAARRPLLDAIGVEPLTSMRMDGWKWEDSPEVAPYAGNKADVPTNEAKIVPAGADAQRIAGGWDIDRIYYDFNTGFLEAFQTAAVKDYRNKSQAYLIDGHAAIVGPPAIPAFPSLASQAYDAGDSTSAIGAVQLVVSYLVANGASVDFVYVAGDVYASLMDLTAGEAPWWLAAASSVNLSGEGDMAGTTFLVDPNLAPGLVMAGDRDAVSMWETGPINVTAVNLPNGGIDFGIFGYYANLVHDNDGLAIANVTGLTATRRTTKKAAASS